MPAATSVSTSERLRSAIGALVGIFVTGLVSGVAFGQPGAAAWLIAPMGASAVLLFAVPASPLAQPWSIVGGNLVSALIGVSCAKLIDAPVPAAAAAIGLAIAAMFALRCIHPPSGAVALTAVLGGPAVHAAGYGFVVAPVGVNTALLLAAALLYNNLTGRRYPHAQQFEPRHQHGTIDAPPTSRLGVTPADLEAVLRRYDQVLDISADDLEGLILQTEMQAFQRRFGRTLCASIMSKDIVFVEFATELDEAWRLMQAHDVRALPVLDRARRVIGIVTRTDFLRHSGPHRYRTLGDRLQTFLRRNPRSHSDRDEVVGQIMSTAVRTVSTSTPIVELVPLMSDAGLHHVPVIDAERRLAGMVTQTDLVAALYESGVAQLGLQPAVAA